MINYYYRFITYITKKLDNVLRKTISILLLDNLLRILVVGKSFLKISFFMGFRTC